MSEMTFKILKNITTEGGYCPFSGNKTSETSLRNVSGAEHAYKVPQIVYLCMYKVLLESYQTVLKKINLLVTKLIRKWKYGDREKIVFGIRADSDCTTLET